MKHQVLSVKPFAATYRDNPRLVILYEGDIQKLAWLEIGPNDDDFNKITLTDKGPSYISFETKHGFFGGEYVQEIVLNKRLFPGGLDTEDDIY